MRVESVATLNIGGLVDQTFVLTSERLLAIAGPNGTGKSKLLQCLLSAWTNSIPESANPSDEAQITVRLRFSDKERDLLADHDLNSGWRQGRPPEYVDLVCSRSSYGGQSRKSVPEFHSVVYGLLDSSILERCPSLDIVYLPAERRLMPSNNTHIDLTQLAETFGVAKLSEARSASSFGRLDDNEFESYAKALCIAGALPSESGIDDNVTAARARWGRFKSAIDELLAPKQLLPLSAEHPEGLRIRLPGGGAHKLDSLSSGERQALVIVSRVFRAGDSHSIVVVDEPDAFLHPSLSVRLMLSLQQGAGVESQMIVATHSPAILDSMPPEAIYKLTSKQGATPISGESDRLKLYRDAGFRASAVSQADALVVTEGMYDSLLIPRALPELANLAFRHAGGRASVLRTLESLTELELPILGVIDSDIDADEVPEGTREYCHIWSRSDIEAVMLADGEFLDCALTGSLLKPSISSVGEARALIQEEVVKFEANAVAEIAGRSLRNLQNISWPKPRSREPISALRAAIDSARVLQTDDVDFAVEQAQARWDAESDHFLLVRGKWVMPQAVLRLTSFRDADAFVNAVLARRPNIEEFAAFSERVNKAVTTHLQDYSSGSAQASGSGGAILQR